MNRIERQRYNRLRKRNTTLIGVIFLCILWCVNLYTDKHELQSDIEPIKLNVEKIEDDYDILSFRYDSLKHCKTTIDTLPNTTKSTYTKKDTLRAKFIPKLDTVRKIQTKINDTNLTVIEIKHEKQ